METTNINSPPRKPSAAGIWLGVLLLIIGFVGGVIGSRFCWSNSSIAANKVKASSSDIPTMVAQPATSSTTSAQLTQWDPFQQLSEIQAQVNQVFQHSFTGMRMDGSGVNIEPNKRYWLSMDVRNLKDQYQVRAFLPDTSPSDVKVNLKGNELKVDMDSKLTEKPTPKNGETAMTEWGNYEETVQLAGGLKDNQMKVQRLPHELIISVPKA